MNSRTTFEHKKTPSACFRAWIKSLQFKLYLSIGLRNPLMRGEEIAMSNCVLAMWLRNGRLGEAGEGPGLGEKGGRRLGKKGSLPLRSQHAIVVSLHRQMGKRFFIQTGPFSRSNVSLIAASVTYRDRKSRMSQYYPCYY